MLKPPKRRCAAMTQQCSLAKGEYGREPVSSLVQASMSQHVDAGMDGVQTSLLNAMRNRAALEPEAHQLRPRDHPVLLGGKVCQSLISFARRTWVTFGMHFMHKVRDVGGSPHMPVMWGRC